MRIAHLVTDSNEIVVKEVPDGLDSMRKLVGGDIELVQVSDEIDMWLNEEGKLLELPPNFALTNDGTVLDIIVGDVFFASRDYEGETVSLTDPMIREIGKRFLTRRNFSLYEEKC